MEEENVQEGLTFGAICRMVLHRIWYVLGATVLVTLTATLIIFFAVNPATRWYSMQFNLVFPTGSESAYPDGEPFFYQDMVTSGYLNEAKKTEGLTGIDTDKMIRKDNIEIAAETRSENGATVYTGRYTLRAKASYFSGEEQAEKFIHAITAAVESEMRKRAGEVNYAVSVETFNDASFEERLNLLAQERETLLIKYDEWIEVYDASYSITAGEKTQTLKDFRAAVTATYGASVQQSLEDELASGGYFFTDNFDAYKEALKAEYERNKTEIEELKKTGTAVQTASYSGLSGATVQRLAATSSSSQQKEDGSVVVEQPALNVSQRLAYLIERNSNILHWLGATELGESGDSAAGTLTAEKNAAFAQKLDAERINLAARAAELTAVTKAIYERGMSARFDIQKVEKEGGVSTIFVLVAALVISFLVACAVVCAVDYNGKRKAARAAEVPAEGEAKPEEQAPEQADE